MKKCKGCGITLQSDDKNKVGYTPKAEADLCQRCFRIKHYGDVTISMRQGIDSDETMKQINSMDALILWVVDLFDFEANMIPGIHRHLMNKDILMVASKRDLLPDSLGNEKLYHFIMRRCKTLGIKINGLIIVGDLVEHAHSDENYSIEEIKKGIEVYRKGRDVIAMGMANAGKSTMLNALTDGKENLTISRFPGTTLGFRKIEMDGYDLYDTPGLTRYDSLLTLVDDSLLKSIVPDTSIKARVYQLKDSQSLSIAGFARLDLFDCKDVTCVGYFSKALQMHRTKQSNADELWSKHLNELLSPAIDTDFKDMKMVSYDKVSGKLDIVIHGLGWFTVSGKLSKIKVYVNKNVQVTFREAMM